MLNDIGNQKLPRFRAGLPLLEQVTAERLNDICAMIEASRLQNGVGYTMNRSAGGTTLTILDTLITKNSKAWRISFGDEFSEMEKSMLAVYTAKDTEELPDIKFPDSAAIRSNIENAFKTFRHRQLLGCRQGRRNDADGRSRRRCHNRHCQRRGNG